jgi:hypothetical protein
MMKEPVVVVSKFWPFLAHIFSQASQDITVKVRFECRARRNKFTVNNSFHVEKTMSMLFAALWTCGACFALSDWALLHCDACCFVSG